MFDSRVQKPQEYNTERFKKAVQKERIPGSLSIDCNYMQPIMVNI